MTLKPDGDKVQARLYLNGNVVAQSDNFTIKPTDISPSLCFIGRSMFKADALFSGHIDDFRIYNYALSDDEVAAIMEDTSESSKDLTDSFDETVPTGINATNATGTSANVRNYDMSGKAATSATRGIVITTGGKQGSHAKKTINQQQ